MPWSWKSAFRAQEPAIPANPAARSECRIRSHHPPANQPEGNAMIHTPVCDMLGIEHPIVLGGMPTWTSVPLVAAVSNAGAPLALWGWPD